MMCRRLGPSIRMLVVTVTGLLFLSSLQLEALSEEQIDAVPRTGWGDPDLQGVWDFRTVTPMERPEEFEGKQFLTSEEAADLEQRAVERQVDRPPRAGDPGTYNQFWMDFGTNIIGTKRTSLITDPPNGRIPDLAPPFVPSIIFATSNGPGPNAPDNDIIITDIANSVKFNSKFNIT